MKNLILAVVLLIFTSFTTAEKQVLKTGLQITVLDELGNAVKGATVELYKTEEDYTKSENRIGEKMLTDAKGKVTIKDLELIVYFVNVEKDGASNYGAGNKTDKLIEKRTNKVTIIILE